MTALPVRAPALGVQLAALLRRQIVTGELTAGAHLVEQNLASDHGVSRGPVRDALRELLTEGLIESRQRGFFVKAFTRRDVDELYEVRGSLEQLACELTIRRRPRDWSAVEAATTAMLRAADAQDWSRFAAHDLAFHTAFYEMSGNTRLEALWRQQWPIFAVLLDLTNSQDADLHPSAIGHVKLLELAQKHEVTAFAQALADHLDGSKQRMCAMLLPDGVANPAGPHGDGEAAPTG